jgi:hypothetical protein
MFNVVDICRPVLKLCPEFIAGSETIGLRSYASVIKVIAVACQGSSLPKDQMFQRQGDGRATARVPIKPIHGNDLWVQISCVES